MKLWENLSESHKKALLEAQKRPKTEEHRAKIGRKGFVMLQHVSSGDIIRVSRDDERLSSTEWVNPRKIKPEPKYKCNHCNVVTTPSNLKRWHNDNCKQRKRNEN
jgi:hypothetical protein